MGQIRRNGRKKKNERQGLNMAKKLKKYEIIIEVDPTEKEKIERLKKDGFKNRSKLL